jgi:uncharacterized protein (TIGR01244 family)
MNRPTTNRFPRPALLRPVTLGMASASVFAISAGMIASCSTPPKGATARSAPTADPMDAVNTVARDRDVWQQLLSDHSKIHRTVLHRQEGDLGIIEATTESDDPAVAARIIDHAKAMQARMVAGAQVRVWDPVFKELFARHDKATLEVTPTAKGVRIVESSRDPETIALLRSHAMGVSDFVRYGHEAGRRETPRLAVDAPLPPPEVAIGGVPHRFLLAQPDASQVALLKTQGVEKLVNFRKPGEPGVYDEQAAALASGVAYCSIPYKDPAELTDALLNEAREQFKSAAGADESLALHCRTGNRVGPGWAMYLALDKGTPVEEAIASAKAVGMVDPLYESITRDAIRRELAVRTGSSAAWTPIATPSAAQEAQKQRAESARSAMFARLFAALGEAMARPGPDGQPLGPAGAISVCKEQAPQIAQAVARERGVMIGRTSDRLRNPANVAPAWATPLLAGNPAEPRLSSNPDGSLGVTLPIKLAANCLACHGDPGTIDPKVRTALASMYPKDSATGYKEGDLRGWFWVEVPPRASAR